MAHFTTINCARVYFEHGEAIECGCSVDIGLSVSVYGRNRPATYWEPEERAELEIEIDHIPNGCPTLNKHDVHTYTDIESAEMDRRADAAAAEYVPEVEV